MVYMAKVFVTATAFQDFTFTVKYCHFTSTFGDMHLSLISYGQNKIPLVNRVSEKMHSNQLTYHTGCWPCGNELSNTQDI